MHYLKSPNCMYIVRPLFSWTVTQLTQLDKHRSAKLEAAWLNQGWTNTRGL